MTTEQALEEGRTLAWCGEGAPEEELQALGFTTKQVSIVKPGDFWLVYPICSGLGPVPETKWDRIGIPVKEKKVFKMPKATAKPKLKVKGTFKL